MSRVSRLFQVLTLLAPLSAAAGDQRPFVVVSDVDDTAKITNVLETKEVIRNGLIGDKTFLGMSELYQELVASARSRGVNQALDPGQKPLIFLSGGYRSGMKRLSKMLTEKNHFPDAEFVMRSDREWIQSVKTGYPTVGQFKGKSLDQMAPHYSMPFILLGDDTENDPAALGGFAARSSGKVLKVYIHRVRRGAPGQKDAEVRLPAGVVPYYTAFDVALSEFQDGRLTRSQVERIGNAILAPGKMGLLFPSFSKCPENLDYPLFVERVTERTTDDPLAALKKQVSSAINAYCRNRNQARETTVRASSPAPCTEAPGGERRSADADQDWERIQERIEK